jgi:hypothetical protein
MWTGTGLPIQDSSIIADIIINNTPYDLKIGTINPTEG